MKITNNRELQQVVINHSSDIGFKGCISLYEKCTAKPSTLTSYNTLRFRHNFSKNIKTNHQNC